MAAPSTESESPAQNGTGESGGGNAAVLMAQPPYPDRFYAAARFAAIPGTVEVSPGSENTTPYSDLTCLALYSLYQQAAHGPCKQPKPWAWNIVELAKWQSWKELGNMHPMEAMRLFVRALEEEDPGWWSKAQELEAQAAAAEAAEALQSSTPKADGVRSPGSMTPKAASALAPNGIAAGADVGASPLPPVVTSLATQLVEAGEGVNTWTVVPTSGRKPTARYQHASIVVSDKMLVVGGNTGRFVNDVQALDLSTLTWSKLEFSSAEGDPLPPCAGHALASVDDKTVLVVGGHKKAGATPSDRLAVLALDMETMTWRTLGTSGDVPSARGGHSVTRVGSTLWVFGGEDRQRHLLSDVYSLDLTAYLWKRLDTKGRTPSPRFDHCATIYNDRYLTIFGGGSHSFCFNDIHVLDLETGEWSSPPSFGKEPSPRAGHAGVAVGSGWFVVGGGDNRTGLCDTMMLDLDTLVWATVTVAQERTPITSEGLTVVPLESPRGTMLLAFGGYNGKYSNEVLVLRPDPEIFASTQAPGTPTAGALLFSEGGADLATAGRPGSAAGAPAEGTGTGDQAQAEAGSAGPPASDAAAPAAGEGTSRAEQAAPAGVVPTGVQPTQDVAAEAEGATDTGPGASAGSSAATTPQVPAVPTSAPQPQASPRGPVQSPRSAAVIEDLLGQLQESQDAVARMEKLVTSERGKANHEAAEARADAWQATAQARKEVDEMREKVVQALAAKQLAEDELAEGTARIVAAQAAAAAAQAEAQKLRKDLADSRGRTQELQAELARIGADAELARVRRDFTVCKQALAEAEQEMQQVRSLLSAEQARCFKLEVEVAELRQGLSEMKELKAELDLLQKQKESWEEAAAAAAAAKPARSGWFG